MSVSQSASTFPAKSLDNQSKPVLVLCSSNAVKLEMCKKIIPKDLIDSAEMVKLGKDDIPEIQGASQEVILAKLKAYLELVGHQFPRKSLLMVDDTIIETMPHNPQVAGFPGASTTCLFPQSGDPPGMKRYKGRLHEIPTCGGVWYTCSIGLIQTDGMSEFHEGTVKGTFVPLTEEKKDTRKNIDPQFLPDGEDQTLDDNDAKHPRRLAIMEMMANSKLIRELLMARDC